MDPLSGADGICKSSMQKELLVDRKGKQSYMRKEQSVHLQKVKICQKCGVEGWSKALIYCHRCRNYTQHRYCLDVLPKTFTEYVKWYCEGCSLEVPKTTKNDIPTSSRKSDCLKAKTQSVGQSSIDENLKQKMENDKKKELVSGSSSLISEELHNEPNETNLNLELSTKSDCVRSNIKRVNESSMDENRKSEKNEEKKKRKTLTPCSSSPVGEDLHNDNPETDQKLGAEVGLILNDEGSNNGAGVRNKINTVEMVSGDPSDMFEQNLIDLTQPIFEPVWRGSLIISNDKFGSVEIAAHLSTKAGLLVYKEARLLPESLSLDLLPRSNVWPKGFGSSGPKDDSIGLYFFPQDERVEKAFDSLVEYMIVEDLAMRAEAANAELLIFTSTQLPLTYWRFQAKYYLWGVFRGRESPAPQAKKQVLVSHSSNKTVVLSNDMGIVEESLVRDLMKTLIRQSPLSPLSDSGSYGSNA